MIVIVDERELVQEGYNSLFDREGVASGSFRVERIRRVGNDASPTRI